MFVYAIAGNQPCTSPVHKAPYRSLCCSTDSRPYP